MKNIYSHLKLEAPFNLIKSLIFHISKKTQKISISDKYFGLCAYINYKTIISIHNTSKIEFNESAFLVCGTENSSFEGWARPNKLYMEKNSRMQINGYVQIGRGSLLWVLNGGTIKIGSNSSTSGNNIIISKSEVVIGRDCQIAWGVTISDHDFHKTYENDIQNPETLPVIIGNNVWIGMNATILKGVEIGDNSIIAAGSVVTHNVLKNTMVGGVPAKLIRENIEYYG